MRRSRQARSLKIPHPLTQVSSRTAGVSAVYANADALAARGVGSKSASLALRLCRFLLVYCDEPSQRKREGQLAQINAQRTVAHWNDAAHIRGSTASVVLICVDRHNSATAFHRCHCRKTGPIRGPRHGRCCCGESSRRTAGEALSRRLPKTLPKTWANAGAFSLLTPGHKLAQY